MQITGFGTYDRSKHPRAGILLDGLGQLGEEVRELNAPLGFSTAERVAMLGRPWLGYRFGLRLLRRWLTLTLMRIRLIGRYRPDAVLVGYLGHFDVCLARLLFPRTLIVLDLMIFAADTATDRGVQVGPKLRLLAMLDQLAIRCADIVVLDTDQHLELMPPGQRGKAVVASVGSPDEWFRPPTPAAVPLRVVFYGLFTPLQAAPVIGAAISKLAPDTAISITMVGSGQDLAATRALAGPLGIGDDPHEGSTQVHWRTWAEPAELRAIVAESSVCLGIFGTGAKGLRVTPNKVYQGAAAGCAIITSDTPPQRSALGDAARYVAPGDSAALAEALRSLAADPDEVDRLQAAAYARAQQHFRPREVARPLQQAIAEDLRRRANG
jgi:glycosyltransferase involved in cell wall biosynthesis